MASAKIPLICQHSAENQSFPEMAGGRPQLPTVAENSQVVVIRLLRWRRRQDLTLFQALTSSGGSRRFSRPHTGDEVHIGNYKLIKTIGKGNFAKVKLARHRPTGVEVGRGFKFWSLVKSW